LAALLHDLGKASTTRYSSEKGRIISYDHDIQGETPAIQFLQRVGAPGRIVDRVIPLVTCHMRYVNFHTGGKVVMRHVRRLSKDLEPATVREWAMVVEADHSGRGSKSKGLPKPVQEFVRIAKDLKIQDSAPKPILMGRHLIEAGMSPGPHFGSILRCAFQTQLDGGFDSLEGAREWLNVAALGQRVWRLT
jgi:tRNA nucleotidyltransferase (CCA-adding enzyme)